MNKRRTDTDLPDLTKSKWRQRHGHSLAGNRKRGQKLHAEVPSVPGRGGRSDYHRLKM